MLLKSIYHDVMKGKRERLNGLRMLTCGAAMFDPAVLQDLMDRGFFIAQMYGLTETCGDGAWNSSQEEKYLTSVGHVDDSCQYKLEDGELCMRGDPVMLGYYKDPEATAEVLEKLLAPCAAIRECRVCERNQRICAVVCCEADQQDAVRDFVTKVNRTLPLYKHMVVEFSSQPLPRNAAGKLLRS